MASSNWIVHALNKLASLGIYPADVPELEEGDEHWRNIRDYFGFYLNPKLSTSEIEIFEQETGIHLPGDYRQFLREVGNGGFGPGEGLEPLGTGPWNDDPDAPGLPFPLDQPFFITSEWLETEDSPEARKKLLNGTLHLAHFGCGIQAILIVCGARYGEVWIADLANDGGVVPACDHWLTQRYAGTGPSFADWYEGWLDSQLAHWSRE